MPNLSCSVTNCMHNKSQMCCLGNITVGGERAHVEDETCCESFAPNSGTNSAHGETPEPHIMIKCSAEECKYNNCTACTANRVAIGGKCESTTCDQTKCSTFSCCK